MLPKTELRYSRIYNIVLNPAFKQKDVIKLKRKFSRFEILYKKYINKLLILIEKYNNKWYRRYIPIYLVDKTKNSFSDPLTIKYNKNEKYLLVVLAHELLHNNLKNGKWKNTKDLHEYMEPILNKIIPELPIDLKREILRFNESIKKMYRR